MVELFYFLFLDDDDDINEIFDGVEINENRPKNKNNNSKQNKISQKKVINKSFKILNNFATQKYNFFNLKTM